MKPTSFLGLVGAACAVLVSLVSTAGAADASAKGVLWETTSQMSMEGVPMAMPSNSIKVCAARDSTQPPGASQRNCRNSNFNRSGDKVTWDVQCTDPAMTGTGEIVYASKDSYDGVIRFTSENGKMTVKISGRKLGGECDNPS